VETPNQPRSKFYDMNVMLFWSSGVAQLICVLLLWWLQIVPGYGLGPQQTGEINS
jgi:hypothetical protein